jgi:hypothetical protein
MKKFTITTATAGALAATATVVASGLIAAVLGLAAPAQAATAGNAAAVLDSAPTGIDHHSWLDDIRPKVNIPNVDTTVHQSR